MVSRRYIVIAAAVMLLAGGCAPEGGRWALDRAPDPTRIKDPFTSELAAGYRDLAQGERAGYDWDAAAAFLDKAAAVGAGEAVAPPELENRDLPTASQAALFDARARLTQMLASRPARFRAPRAVARMQTGFEGWLENAEEDLRPDDIAAWRAKFEAAEKEAAEAAELPPIFVTLLPKQDANPIGGVQIGDKLIDRPYDAAGFDAKGMRTLHVLKEEVEETFGDALAARPPPPVVFTIYFSRGSTGLNTGARAVLTQVKAEIARRAAPDVVVVGHADTKGPPSVNLRLSQRRAIATAAALKDDSAEGDSAEGDSAEGDSTKGDPAESDPAIASLTVSGVGEEDPVIVTDDPTLAEVNRRVVITVR